MLKLNVLLSETYDEELGEFNESVFELHLEHSLVALSKWESEFEKPFLGKEDKTEEEILHYIRVMVLNDDVPEEVFRKLSTQNYLEINNYISKKMTATWFSDSDRKEKAAEIITSELIYYWLNVLEIDLEVETWHLNRLFTLIKIHSAKNSKPKKQSRSDMISERRALNEKRKKELNTTG